MSASRDASLGVLLRKVVQVRKKELHLPQKALPGCQGVATRLFGQRDPWVLLLFSLSLQLEVAGSPTSYVPKAWRYARSAIKAGALVSERPSALR